MLVLGEIVIDRRQGTQHPRFPDCIYPFDYGYVKGSKSTDSAEIDVWCKSISNRRVTGIIIAADAMKKDVEIKILLGMTEEDIATVLDFNNGGEQHAMFVANPLN